MTADLLAPRPLRPLLAWINRWADRNPDRVQRINQWLDRHLDPPRCPWTTAGGADQCARNAGHRGLCETHYNYGPPHTWYGINFPERKAL